MQQSRYELKYLITEDSAARVRDFVSCYLGLDEYSVGRPNFSYPVHSLYLDNDDLEIYWRTVNGDKNRFKLRLRYYTDKPGTPVFFEVKRRMKDVIQKQRGGVKQESVARILNGQLPEGSDMISKDPKSMVSVQRFFQHMAELNARPCTHIFYMREAYVSDDDQVRVTLDRDVFSEPNPNPTTKIKMVRPVHSYKGFVILELKFTNKFPNWFGDLVRVAQVTQTGAAKYVSGVTELGHVRLGARAPVMEEPSVISRFRPGDDLPTFAQQDTGIPWSLVKRSVP
jgi:hypothetical protein